MADLIDRQTIIETIHSAMYTYFCGAEDGDILSEDEKLVLSVNKTICTAIKALPSADVQPVRHEHWVNEGIYGEGHSQCSIRCSNPLCNYHYIGYLDDYNYCPNCGARMDGEHDG